MNQKTRVKSCAKSEMSNWPDLFSYLIRRITTNELLLEFHNLLPINNQLKIELIRK